MVKENRKGMINENYKGAFVKEGKTIFQ